MTWTDAAWRYLRAGNHHGPNDDLTLLAICHLADRAGEAGQSPHVITAWVADLTTFAPSTTARHLDGWVRVGVVERDAHPGLSTHWRPTRRLRLQASA